MSETFSFHTRKRLPPTFITRHIYFVFFGYNFQICLEIGNENNHTLFLCCFLINLNMCCLSCSLIR